MMPVTHKIAAQWCAVGIIAGALLVAFVFYPPHSGWNERLEYGDLATWLTAIGTMGAVVAALFLARKDSAARHEEIDARGLVIASFLFSDCNTSKGLAEKAIAAINGLDVRNQQACNVAAFNSMQLVQKMNFELIEKNLEKVAWLPSRHSWALASFPAMKNDIVVSLATMSAATLPDLIPKYGESSKRLKKMLELLNSFINDYSSRL
ncbi:hypothetical protein [Rhodanobacter sp. DHB23]|uniref:hypothetical protein n=1 Tax=Rhodanobacter sp. DHB23 TaxID=2775923 RepID=UPI001780A948|nr:hypothetical protein [Rhodanobacter sp. DHB23]MBD8873855.1 hypothetical protein [Rhodanobacter sp. DHB23]